MWTHLYKSDMTQLLMHWRYVTLWPNANASTMESRCSHLILTYQFVLLQGHSPLVFGVETEGELREWIVALKLLAGKANGVQRRSLPIEISPWERRHSANSALGDSERGSDSITPQADIFAMFYNHRGTSDFYYHFYYHGYHIQGPPEHWI